MIVFYCLCDKHSMNVKQIICGSDARYNPSDLCCLPPQKCVANLHDNSKSNMAAIVNKVYLRGILFIINNLRVTLTFIAIYSFILLIIYIMFKLILKHEKELRLR